ncbi:callose synthase [Thraustotheca clavata]|uniref:Callose synthase n=1 Tax=Thraustotheca clavata TaxID=74557 RepID=A0A1V9Z5Z6_9STRA|nr:callose synthase [Thraustotheca clavata]
MIRKTRFLLVAIGLYLQMMYRIFYKDQNKTVSTNLKEDGVFAYYQPYIIVAALFILMILLVCCGYCASRFTKKSQMKQRKLRKIKFNASFMILVIFVFSLIYLTLTELLEICLIIAISVYWFIQVMIVRLKSGHIVVHSLGKFYDRAVGWIVFGPILFIAMFMPFISSFQQRVMFNSAFTSGLEVSKLFANDAVPTQTLKGKKTKKKKRED